MTQPLGTPYLEPTQDAGRHYFSRGLAGPVVMLNLLRFRAVADYSATPDLRAATPISGAEAYARYVAHTRPFLEEAGGELLFVGQGGAVLIGPPDEQWDLAVLTLSALSAVPSEALHFEGGLIDVWWAAPG